MSMDINIANINRFLSDYAPEEYHRLLERHPESLAILKSKGLPMGSTDLSVAKEAARTMLGQVDEASSEAIGWTLKRLRTRKQVEIIGSALALITSGGVVGTILSVDEIYLTAALGAIGFLASLATLISGWLASGVAGDLSVDDAYAKLQEHTWQARLLQTKLTGELTEDGLNEVLQLCNALAKEVFLVLAGLGYKSSLRPI